MPPYALKMLWFVGCLVGTFLSCLAILAHGKIVGSLWAPVGFAVGLAVFEGMFCLGMIWKMDPFEMPRGFCIAQAIIMEISIYALGGLTTAYSIATTLHVARPKRWSDMKKSFRWRPVYIVPVVVYPVVATIIQLTLVFTFDAIQPREEMHCDASGVLWVRLVGHSQPLILLIPAILLGMVSMRRVLRTWKHVDRARRDNNELPRQLRRERVSENRGCNPSGPVHLLDDLASLPHSPNHQPIDHASLALTSHTTTRRRLSFHFPFFHSRGASGQPFTPPLEDDGDDRVSVASSSFPTFAPMPDKPTRAARHPQHSQPELESDDLADISVRPWDEDSSAPTSNTGHDAPEIDVKTQDDDEQGTYRLSYREHTASPTRISHLANVPTYTPQIQRLIFYQCCFPAFLVFTSLSSIIDVASHQTTPRPFGSHHVIILTTAWGPCVIFGSLSDVRALVWSWLLFWRR